VIARHGRPIARLVSYKPRVAKRRKLGLLAGKLKVPDNFDDPLPDDVLDAFEGRR
jgi:antitoxin (DNA-binding transcriptional repressor) of toxin-antitoxin stability system